MLAYLFPSRLLPFSVAEEFDSEHLKGAIAIAFNQLNFTEEFAKLDKEGTYTVYYRSDNRSAQVAETMHTAEISRIVDAGGFKVEQN